MLLSETKKHSSNTIFGSSYFIGLEVEIITSGFETKAIFYCIPCCIFDTTKGVLPILLSNKSGWLQTFLNCMTKFIKFSTFALLDASMNKSWAEIFLLILSYRTFWRWVMMHVIIYSVFGAISCSTSFLSLLNMKGWRIRWSLLSWCLFSSPWSIECYSISLENHS